MLALAGGPALILLQLLTHSFELLHGLKHPISSEAFSNIQLASRHFTTRHESFVVRAGLLASLVMVFNKVEICLGGKELGLEADLIAKVFVVEAQALANSALLVGLLKKHGNLLAHIGLSRKGLLRALHFEKV